MGDRIVVPVDRPRGVDDGLLAFDPATGRIIWEGSMPAGADWRLAAGNGLIVAAGSPDRVVGIDATDGTVAWTQEVSIGWWGRLLVADGFAFVPTFEGRAAKTVTALRLSDGRPAWTWTEWPGGDCGPRCDVVWSKPAAADEGLLLVTSDARSCPPGTPSVECDATPSYRTRVTALDIATGNRAWTRDAVRKDLLGEVAVVDGVVVVQARTLSLLDLRTGDELAAIPAPDRPGTYGIQQAWGEPIPAGSRLIVGADDGTVTAFSIAIEVPRPQPGTLTPDMALPVPPPSSQVPTATRSPATAGAADGSWIVGVAIVATAGLLIAAVLTAALARRRPRGPALPAGRPSHRTKVG
jgi:outer membrane protein assembly factor BamB